MTVTEVSPNAPSVLFHVERRRSLEQKGSVLVASRVLSHSRPARCCARLGAIHPCVLDDLGEHSRYTHFDVSEKDFAIVQFCATPFSLLVPKPLS